MEKNLKDVIEALTCLSGTIEKSGVPENINFDEQYGWNNVHIQTVDITNFITNLTSKLESYGDIEITKGLQSTIESHVENLTRLDNTLMSYYTNNSSHMLYMVPVILLTLMSIASDFEFELFSWENLQDKKLLPKNLASRIRSTKSLLDSFDESCRDFDVKISTINEAHEAAESLPTDLASLKEAKIELSKTLNLAHKELKDVKREIDLIKNEILGFHNDAKKACDETQMFNSEAKKSADSASKLVDECDEALQITTTQGLAAGFDQKASELRGSILGLDCWAFNCIECRSCSWR